MTTPEFAELVVDGDELVADGGFLKLRRLRLRTRRTDGSLSRGFVCDGIARPYGQDAVIVAVYARRADGGIDVLVRDGMRPTVYFGRDASIAPLPEPPPTLFVTELVAGILEAGDVGEAGLRTRAAHETLEEAGFAIDPARVVVLGGGGLPSPGCLVEKYYFTAVEVDPATQVALPGDGSPMEEGATTRWLDLDDALARCTAGDIADLKTEVGLRRLRDHLR